MIIKAVIDRFEAASAIVLLKDGGQKLIIPKVDLPPKASEGDWIQITLEGESLHGKRIQIELDEAETQAARQRINEKLAQLRRGDHLKK
jgi:hypothetical protein